MKLRVGDLVVVSWNGNSGGTERVVSVGTLYLKTGTVGGATTTFSLKDHERTGKYLNGSLQIIRYATPEEAEEFMREEIAYEKELKQKEKRSWLPR